MTVELRYVNSINGSRIGGDKVAFLDGIKPPPWSDDALCARTDPDLFFPDKGGSTKQAKETCAECPLRETCLQWALDHDERFGIWGGLAPQERAQLGGKAPRRPRPETELICQHCNGTYKVTYHKKTRKYCSSRCSRLAQNAAAEAAA